MWFLDCFIPSDSTPLGRVHKFHPVNTYFHEDLGFLIEKAKKILEDKGTGISSIRIGKDSDGQCPMELQ